MKEYEIDREFNSKFEIAESAFASYEFQINLKSTGDPVIRVELLDLKLNKVPYGAFLVAHDETAMTLEYSLSTYRLDDRTITVGCTSLLDIKRLALAIRWWNEPNLIYTDPDYHQTGMVEGCELNEYADLIPDLKQYLDAHDYQRVAA